MYFLSNQDTTVYDHSLLSFTDAGYGTTVSVYSTDNHKVGIYPLTIKAKFTNNTVYF